MPDDLAKIPRKRGHKNKPAETAWHQQRLPSLRPTSTLQYAIPATFIVGLAFCGIGAALYAGANSSLEEVADYTDCIYADNPFVNRSDDSFVYNNNFTCNLNIVLQQNFTGDVKFLYGMKKFYQNTRLYLNSRNDMQYYGKLDKTSGCDPYDKFNDTEHNKEIIIAPCGTIANSMFNDSFMLFLNTHTTTSMNGAVKQIPFTGRGVLTERERKRKFKNPDKGNGTLCDAFANTTKPPFWRQSICELGSTNESVGVGFENIDFMVWMKPAALPNFRKTYRILDREVEDYDNLFANGLPAGNYTLKLQYNYPVGSYGGSKYFIIAAESWTGPRNFFLAIVYLVVGGLLVIFSIALFLLHLKFNRFRNRAD